MVVVDAKGGERARARRDKAQQLLMWILRKPLGTSNGASSEKSNLTMTLFCVAARLLTHKPASPAFPQLKFSFPEIGPDVPMVRCFSTHALHPRLRDLLSPAPSFSSHLGRNLVQRPDAILYIFQTTTTTAPARYTNNMSGWTTVWVFLIAAGASSAIWVTTPKGPNQV